MARLILSVKLRDTIAAAKSTFAQDFSKLHRDNSSVGPLTAIPPVYLILTILASKEAENMVQLLLSEAPVSLEKYLSNFNLHPRSFAHVFPPTRVLMS